VVAARTRLALYSSAFPAALSFAPLSTLSSASSLAPLWESSSRGGDVIVLGIIHLRCERRLVNSRASGRLCRARRPPPLALMGAIILLGVVVDATAAASTLSVRRAAIVTRASLAAKAVASSSPLAAEAAASLLAAAAVAASARLAALTLASTVRRAAIVATDSVRLGAQ
jgi:hypothetical protein